MLRGASRSGRWSLDAPPPTPVRPRTGVADSGWTPPQLIARRSGNNGEQEPKCAHMWGRRRERASPEATYVHCFEEQLRANEEERRRDNTGGLKTVRVNRTICDFRFTIFDSGLGDLCAAKGMLIAAQRHVRVSDESIGK